MYGSEYVDAVERQTLATPDRIAFSNSAGKSMTYAQLRERSNALACWLTHEAPLAAGVPVVLYGHKDPVMLAAMFACVKAGHAYVPIDVVYPAGRVASILGQIGRTLVIDTSVEGLPWAEFGLDEVPYVLANGELEGVLAAVPSPEQQEALPGIGYDSTFYVLFTSGSTGTPKGVEMPTRYVDYFARWLKDIYRDRIDTGEREAGLVWFNRSPFTFDLSTNDLFAGLVSGDKIFALETEAETSFKATFDAFAQSDITDWVSTPSFVDSCLADDSFSCALLPHLRRITLAGETLRKDTVMRLRERFPGITVFNDYGPTETGTVTFCEVTDAMLADERSLPIGYASPGVEPVVVDPKTFERKPANEAGELYIVGDMVANGYWGRPDLTDAGFHALPESIAQGRRSYKTGDECVMAPDGLLYYHGRLDGMLKLHGYRIETGEIEQALSALPEVDLVCVLPVRRDDGSVSRLVAAVQPAASCSERGLKLTRKLKVQVRDTLPAYMIPSTFKYVDRIELNANGKADRKALAQAIGI